MEYLKVVVFLTLAAANELGGRGMDMDKPKEFHPVDAGTKTFHWILTLCLLLILPSVSTCLAIANRFSWSLFLQLILGGYLIFELFFLSFPDNVDNHENKTSTGTSLFLTALLGCTVFIGSLMNGTNIVINKFYPQYARYGEGSGGIIRRVYKTLSVMTVLTGWVRVSIAPIALFGFCYGKHTGQCIAHGIMGSSFIGYGFVLFMVLVVPWLRKRTSGRPQEFYDSIVMCAWGIVNTFTEHRWGREPWSMGDYDHTSMGIVWACGGFLGIWLSRNQHRSFIPAALLIWTGWSMSQHVQHLEISTKVHAIFGLALMGAGFSRIVEILIVLKDKYFSEENSGKIVSFQYLPPTCLVLSGLLFMAATEEQLILVHDLGSTHAAYILVVVGAGFMICLWMLMLISLYLKLVGYDEDGELKTVGYLAVNPNEVDTFELSDLSDNDMVRVNNVEND